MRARKTQDAWTSRAGGGASRGLWRVCTGPVTLRQGRYVLRFVAAEGQTRSLLGARRWWSGSRGASTPSAKSGRLPGVAFWKVENAALPFHYSLLRSVDPSWSFSEVCLRTLFRTGRCLHSLLRDLSPASRCSAAQTPPIPDKFSGLMTTAARTAYPILAPGPIK